MGECLIELLRLGKMTPPVIGAMYVEGMPADAFKRFADALSDDHLTVHLEKREPPGPQAGIMWAMLTQGAVFIGAAYFGETFKQLGKEHFEKLRKCLAELTQTTMDTPRIEPVLIGTSGKVNPDDLFSMAFSVYANLPHGKTVKLLIPKNRDGIEYELITNAFLDFVVRCYSEGDEALVEAGFDSSYRSNPVTVAFSSESNTMKWMDPRKH